MTTRDEQESQRIDGLYVEHMRRIALVMREHYPKVLAANRFFEEETGLHNELGSNNLNDALSHLGTLLEGASEMTWEQQANEVHDFEGHLRRGMMESYEQVFRMRMGEVEKRWQRHLKVARPLLEQGKLHGVPGANELGRLRRVCKNLLEDGRAAKRGHDWELWDKGTEALAEACKTASALYVALDQGIAAAEQQQSDRRGFRLSAAIAIVTALVCLPAGWLVNDLLSAHTVRIPDVTHVSIAAASIELGNDDLHVMVEPSSALGARCVVNAESPRPGDSVDAGSSVTLVALCR
jgi:hypothetical protein